ncbi:MAG: efflux RND transporter permease subunit, partial [Planctomycetota bacterium]
MKIAEFGVRKPVVANLVMLAVIGAGLIFGSELRREFFPYIEPRQVSITAPYPGAAPDEVESALAKKIEDRVADLTAVKELNSTVSEGLALVTVEFEEGTPIDLAVADVKREVDALQDLPPESDRIVVDKFEANLPAIVLTLSGDSGERTMKEFMRQTRDDLLTLPEITDVLLGGQRGDELRVEVSPELALKHGLSLTEISDRITAAMSELPGGSVRGDSSTVSVRSMGVEERADEVGDIVVRAGPEGSVIRVRDVAEVSEGFVDNDLVVRFNGRPAMSLTVFRVADQDVIRIAELVKAYVAGRRGEEIDLTLGERLRLVMARGSADRTAVQRHEAAMEAWEAAGSPPGGQPSPSEAGFDPSSVSERYEAYSLGFQRFQVSPTPGELVTTTDLARFVQGRLDLLTRNALQGGALVFITLVLLLNWRISFWVAAGLVVSLLGTLAVMHWFDVTLNLLTMFGLIIVIGILVDDAIVVAENIKRRHEEGEDATTSAIRGSNQV